MLHMTLIVISIHEPMTCEWSQFQTYEPIEPIQVVILGNNITQAIVGLGNVSITPPHGKVIIISIFLHVQGLQKNLCSIRHLDTSKRKMIL